MDYVHALRVEEARQIIESTDTGIDEVGYLVGYEDPTFFRRLFKRQTGLTPAAYRASSPASSRPRPLRRARRSRRRPRPGDPRCPTASPPRPARTCSSTPTTRSTGSRGAPTRSRARKLLDRPIFLSIGYAACHWCHVMERESFEHEATARYLNDHFIAIKVDREERPDLDQLYMGAVQAMTGGGGWPMSVFLTPDGRPFYGGTYFPDEPRHGMPSFRQVLEGVDRSLARAARRGRGRRDAPGRDARRPATARGRTARPDAGTARDRRERAHAVVRRAQRRAGAARPSSRSR